MSAAVEYLVKKGREVQTLGSVMLRNLADEIERTDFDTIFANDEEMGTNVVDAYSALVANVMPYKMVTSAAMVASGVDTDEIIEANNAAQAEVHAKLNPESVESTEVNNTDMSFLEGIDLDSLADTPATVDTDTTDE